jgi:hypothetical protein
MIGIDRKVIPGLFILCSLASCLNPRMVNRWVAEHYQEGVPPPAKKKNETIGISSKLAVTDDKLSSTKKDVSHVLPLIIYIQFDYKNICTLNPQLPVSNFTSAVTSYSGAKLKQKLNGGHLELTIERMPNVMILDDKGKMFLLTIGVEWLSVSPQIQDMVVSYRLLSAANEEIKKGTITIQDNDHGLSLGMFQSMKKLTWRYLDQYDANITAMSRKFVDRLITEL